MQLIEGGIKPNETLIPREITQARVQAIENRVLSLADSKGRERSGLGKIEATSTRGTLSRSNDGTTITYSSNGLVLAEVSNSINPAPASDATHIEDRLLSPRTLTVGGIDQVVILHGQTPEDGQVSVRLSRFGQTVTRGPEGQRYSTYAQTMVYTVGDKVMGTPESALFDGNGTESTQFTRNHAFKNEEGQLPNPVRDRIINAVCCPTEKISAPQLPTVSRRGNE